MHRRAEYGVAAHWKYKEDGRAGVDTDQAGDLDDMTWVRQLLDWQSDVEDPGEFLESLRFEINRAEVYVFTPRGDVIALPTGCDPGRLRVRRAHRGRPPHDRRPGQRPPGAAGVDARQQRRGRGLHLQGANAGPSRDWLTFVKSPRARSKIRQWFTKERREEAIEQGKEQIAKLMRKEGLPLKRLLSHESLMLAAVHFKLADVSALYAAVGEGNLSAQAVVRRVIDLHGGDDGAPRTSPRASRSPAGARSSKVGPGGDAGVIVKGAPDVWVKLAKCCTPVPPDEILGFVTKGGGVSVHRTDCTNADEPAQPARAAARGRVGADRPVDVPGQHPGRGARPGPPAVRHHHGALGRAREHPQRQPLDHPRPGRQEPLHLRDGRVQAPRQRAARRPLRARRLRRLPRHPVAGPPPVSGTARNANQVSPCAWS